jgi:acetyl esterase/lipase
VPFYPLGPEAGCEEAVGHALEVYRALIRHVPAEEVTVMGDSAGGGLALILSQRLAALGERQPRRLVLLSPWLDLTMANPAIAAVEPRDPYLTVAAALEAARFYAGPARLADPLASPIYGPMRGLAPITVFGGTADILAPDARRLRDLVLAAEGSIDLVEYEGMMHAFMLFPIPEAGEAMKAIAAAAVPENVLAAVA